MVVPSPFAAIAVLRLSTRPPVSASVSAAAPPVNEIPAVTTMRRTLRTGVDSTSTPFIVTSSIAAFAVLRRNVIESAPAVPVIVTTACCCSTTLAALIVHAPRPCVPTTSRLRAFGFGFEPVYWFWLSGTYSTVVTIVFGRFRPSIVHSTFGAGLNARQMPTAVPTSSTPSVAPAPGTYSIDWKFALKRFCETSCHVQPVPLFTAHGTRW